VLTAPNYISNRWIEKFIKSKEKWLTKKLAEQTEKKSVWDVFEAGQTFIYMGNPFILTFLKGPKKAIYFDGPNLVISNPDSRGTPDYLDKLKTQLKKWMIELSKEIIKDRVEIYAKNFRPQPKNITIRSQKTRWGSCSSSRNLNFNWQLIQASLETLDYVVIHELCHLVHMNHSKRFWDLVETHCPDYKVHRNWLRKNGHLLKF